MAAPGPETESVTWIPAAESPWGVRLLDVRPITLTMLSASRDESCARNAISFGGDDGTSFIGKRQRARA